MADARKEYLGDAVYADIDAYGALVLTTEDGLRATNRIVLEPEVLAALEGYLKRARDRVKRPGGITSPQLTELDRLLEAADCTPYELLAELGHGDDAEFCLDHLTEAEGASAVALLGKREQVRRCRPVENDL